MPCLLSSFQAAETTPDWLQSFVKGLPVFMSIGDLQQVAHESRAFTTPRPPGSGCGHVWLSGFLGSFHMVDVFPSRWSAQF